MEPVLLGLALGAGALYVAKRGRGAMQSAVGWTARKSGWLASRVRSSLDETKAVAREQYQRGRREAAKAAPHSPLPPLAPLPPLPRADARPAPASHPSSPSSSAS